MSKHILVLALVTGLAIAGVGEASAGNTSTNTSNNTSTNTSSDPWASNSSSNNSSNASDGEDYVRDIRRDRRVDRRGRDTWVRDRYEEYLRFPNEYQDRGSRWRDNVQDDD